MQFKKTYYMNVVLAIIYILAAIAAVFALTNNLLMMLVAYLYIISIPVVTAVVLRKGVINGLYKYALITNVINSLIGLTSLFYFYRFEGVFILGLLFILCVIPLVINLKALHSLTKAI